MKTSKKKKKGRELSFSISIINLIWVEMLLKWLRKEMRKTYPLNHIYVRLPYEFSSLINQLINLFIFNTIYFDYVSDIFISTN
jgi:hypothetical protein